MATNDDTKAMEEIYRGITNLRERLEGDVREMCDLVCNLRAEFYAGLKENSQLNNYKESFDHGCSDIYWSLKLHLAFHCGNDSVSGHVNLGNLRRSLNLNELDKVPGEEHAVDPGSKVCLLYTSDAADE